MLRAGFLTGFIFFFFFYSRRDASQPEVCFWIHSLFVLAPVAGFDLGTAACVCSLDLLVSAISTEPPQPLKA
jgi:hypothetical protein